jgi:hypothetical protein
MTERKHLFLALSRKGWGETSLGLEVARQLRAVGDTVCFLAHSGSILALAGAGFQVQEVPEHLEPLLGMVLEECLADGDFDAIVLCDYATTDYTLRRGGLNARCVLDYGLPVIALDTWEYAATGSTIDMLGNRQWPLGTWMSEIEYRLIPVPFGRPFSPGAYCSLPAPIPFAANEREMVRQELGLSHEQHAVLFCTAGWQHAMCDTSFDNALMSGSDGRRLAQAVPQLLWSYVNQAAPEARLIHVGPVPLSLDGAPMRYQWMPSLSPENFDRLLGSVDLLLTANISATTIGRAMMIGLPVLAVENSFRVQDIVEAEQKLGECGKALTPRLRQWVEDTAPLYPFRLWPLGYWEFLDPLMSGNPYCEALDIVELLDEAEFVHRCRRLLLDPQARQDARSRQAAYVAQARRLPSAAQVIDRYLTGKEVDQCAV